MDELVQARHLVELGYLEEIFKALGYRDVQLLEKSDDIPYHTLFVALEPDAKGRAKQMALTFYPVAEFEDTLLLQYFIPLPFKAEPKQLPQLYTLLPELNSKLVLGHFGFSSGEGTLHLRYVQALNASDLLTQERVADVITLVTFSTVLFEGVLEDLVTGKLSVAQALAKLDEQSTQLSSAA